MDQQPTAAPQPTTQPPAPNTPSGGTNKKLLFGIIGAVIGLFVIIGVVLTVVVLGSVSQEDYEEAYNGVKDVRDAYSDMSGKTFISTYATETERKNDLDSLKQAREEFNTSLDAMADMKAVKRDSEVNEAYTKLADKKENFNKALDAIQETYEHVLPAVAEVRSLRTGDDVSGNIADARKSFADIEANLQNGTNKEFVSKMVTILKKYEGLAKKVEAYRKDYSKYDSKVSSEYYDTSSELSDAVRDWTSNIKKMTEDAEIKDEINDLGQLLADKSSPA